MFHLRLFVDTDSDVRLSRRGKGLQVPDCARVPQGSQGGLMVAPCSCCCSSPGCAPREGPGADSDPVHHLREASL